MIPLCYHDNENFVFSNLGSYADRPLKLDSTGLGASNHLDREAYILTTKYRSGLFVPLRVNKALLVRGRLASEDLEQVKYAYGKILTDDGKVFSNNFFTDETGNFLIDGLSYGKYRIELSNRKIETISFELIESAGAIKAKETGEAEDTDSSEYEMGTIKIEKKAGT